VKRDLRVVPLFFAILLHAVFGASCLKTPEKSEKLQRSDSIPVYKYRLINTYPHDTTAFTQGLVFEKGFLYEGTGQRGRSVLRRVELNTGRILKERRLENKYFGEGITVLGDRIFQLTWTSKTGFIYDKTTFSQITIFSYNTQGWGITHDGKNLIMSDGTEIRLRKSRFGTTWDL
jgi:glutamine cyclotransferase